MNFPTEIQEYDVLALLAMDDRTLANSCSSNLYLNKLCNNDHFWLLRLQSRGFGDYVALKGLVQFPTYRDLYFSLLNAAYVVIFDDHPYICSNINEAYQIFITFLSLYALIDISNLPPIEGVAELANIVQNLQVPVTIEIYILFGEIYLGDSTHLLLGVNGKSDYNVGRQMGNVKWTITPNLYQMPDLNPENTYIFYMITSKKRIFSTQTIIALTRMNDNTLSRLVDYSLNETLYEDEFWIRKVNNNYDQYITQRKEQRLFRYNSNLNLFISFELPIIVIGKGQDHYYMATLSLTAYKSLVWVRKMKMNGQEVLRPRTSSLYNLLPQIHSTLNWESIQNIANYPINENLLQELQQRLI
jgi:hypothetical protein